MSGAWCGTSIKSMYGAMAGVLSMPRLLYTVSRHSSDCAQDDPRAARAGRQRCRGISTLCRRVRVSTFADNASPNTYNALAKMSASTATSKAFRALLQLREHEVLSLQRWAMANCAMHATFASDRGAVVIVCLRDTRRTSASFSRTLRAAMQKLVIPTSGLRGHWLHLISEAEAVSLCSPAINAGAPLVASARAHDEADVRVVQLY